MEQWKRCVEADSYLWFLLFSYRDVFCSSQQPPAQQDLPLRSAPPVLQLQPSGHVERGLSDWWELILCNSRSRLNSQEYYSDKTSHLSLFGLRVCRPNPNIQPAHWCYKNSAVAAPKYTVLTQMCCVFSPVALNFQTPGEQMDLNHGRFLQNGQCGYVMKPPFMCPPDIKFNPENVGGGPGHQPVLLTVRVRWCQTCQMNKTSKTDATAASESISQCCQFASEKQWSSNCRRDLVT